MVKRTGGRVGDSSLHASGTEIGAAGFARVENAAIDVSVDAFARARRGHAFRTTHQRQRPIDEVGKNPVGDRLVVAREAEFRDAGRREQHPVGMREADAGDIFTAFGTRHAD